MTARLEQLAREHREARAEAAARWQAWKDLDARWQALEAPLLVAVRRSRAALDAAAGGDGDLAAAAAAYRDALAAYRASELGQLDARRQDEFYAYQEAAGRAAARLRSLRSLAAAPGAPEALP